MKSRITTLLLSAALLLLLSACQTTPTPAADTSSPSSSETPTPSPSETPAGTDLADVPTGLVAATVNGIDISMEEFNFHYFSAYYWLVESGYAAYYGITDPSLLASTYVDEETTWAQYFANNAMNTLCSVVAASEDALANGVTLSDEQKSALDAGINELTAAAEAESKELNVFLADNFGTHMTADIYRTAMERVYMADAWYTWVNRDTDLSDAALDAYYAQNADTLDLVDYNLFFFREEEEAEANEMLTRLTPDNFADLCLEYMDEGEEPTSPLQASIPLQTITAEDVRSFLSDPARKTGDAELFLADGYHILAQFLNRRPSDAYTVDVRHILVSSDNEDAADAADELYAQWLDNPTEELFSNLAAANTDDTASIPDGGLYASVAPGTMVPQFNDWCFDAARTSGDSGIVETDYGFHIMYFVQKNGLTWKTEARTTLMETVAGAARTALFENLTYELNDIEAYIGR